jgi:hypothetical protein
MCRTDRVGVQRERDKCDVHRQFFLNFHTSFFEWLTRARASERMISDRLGFS